MFELSVACKYLTPRRRQLSVSIISLISVLVIALVVWLIVVFFSVTNGLEKNWIQKLTALTAPIRITPTEAYFHSYYSQIDTISESSQYIRKTISEKQAAEITDPYDPDVDEEIPTHWPAPDKNSDGSLKDFVKLAYSALNEIKDISGLSGNDFELTASHIRLRLLRQQTVYHASNIYGSTTQSVLSYPAFLGNFEENNPNLGKTLLKIENRDINNLFHLIGIANQENLEDTFDEKALFDADVLQRRLKNFFNFITIQQLKSSSSGWIIPSRLLPLEFSWDVCAILKDQRIVRVIIPVKGSDCLSLQKSLEAQGLTVVQAKAIRDHETFSIIFGNGEVQVLPRLALTLASETSFSAKLDATSYEHAKQIEDVLFDVNFILQGMPIEGKIPFRGLEIAEALINSSGSDSESLLWIQQVKQSDGSPSFILPKDLEIGEGVVLPKSFRDAGVMIGDRGSLSYLAPTASVLQEQHIPIYVAGFYDPGIIPIGGKFILANREATQIIRSSHQQDDKSAITNGINVRFDRIDQADVVKDKIVKAFKEKGIHRYWKVETYREFEFTKEIMRELQSQKNLFMLIAVVIILVACSNIISMLIILVNDKKLEIGILRSMGASSKSIALIFGFAGACIGVLGSTMGIIAAILTLHHLDILVGLLSRLQGHDMFSANLYGHVLPQDLSFEALLFVLIATVCISLLAGIVPAIKASLIRPSHILRKSGG